MRMSDWSSDVCSSDLVEVVLHNMDRENQVQALRERRIVVGFNRFFREEADLTWETLVTETMLVAVPSNHRLAKNRSLSIEDLANEPLVFYPRVERPQGFTDYLMRMFHSRNITRSQNGSASCRERVWQSEK